MNTYVKLIAVCAITVILNISLFPSVANAEPICNHVSCSLIHHNNLSISNTNNMNNKNTNTPDHEEVGSFVFS